MKTSFGPGVIVTSKFLNGAQQLYFDGVDADWHYDPLTTADIQRGGTTGFDTHFVTTTTDQEYGNTPGISGKKSFMGQVLFGSSSSSTSFAAPLSYNTNARFNIGGSGQAFTLKYANLEDADLITKQILSERMDSFPIIDEGSF